MMMKVSKITPQQKIDRLKKAGYQVQEKGNKIRAAKGSLIINGTINQVHKEVFKAQRKYLVGKF